jgi:hypothetical protein
MGPSRMHGSVERTNVGADLLNVELNETSDWPEMCVRPEEFLQ